MGVNLPPQAQQALQQQALQKQALTPLAGANSQAAGAGLGGGLSQLAIALLANKKRSDWQKQYGIQQPKPPGTTAAAMQGSAPSSTPEVGGSDID